MTLEIDMTDNGFTTTFTVPQSADTAFRAMTDVRGWWTSDIDGDTDRLGAEFDYRYETAHRSRFRITELVPGRRIRWQVLDNRFTSRPDNAEWDGTAVSFTITPTDEGTRVVFTHHGLLPECECYQDCSAGWTLFVGGSLRRLIETGVGEPHRAGRAPAPEVATAG